MSRSNTVLGGGADMGKRIAIAMAWRGITQAELSRKSGVPAVQIGRYVRGEFQPSSESLFRVAKALDVRASWLFSPVDEAEDPPRELLDLLWGLVE